MLTNPEIDIITRDFIEADNKQATDIFFETSFLLNYFMKQHKGIWLRPGGGDRIKVHLKYDGAEGGFYERNSTLSEDERQNITAAFFAWAHAFGNATLYRADELQNAGEWAEIENLTNKVTTAMETCRNVLAQNIYNQAGDGSKLITGLFSLTSEAASVAYGTLTENSVVAADGQKPWEGKTNSTETNLTTAVVRTLRSDAKIYDGKDGKPNIGITTETLYNKLVDQLEIQQRFTASDEMAKAGFTGLSLDGMMISADDFLGASNMLVLNSKHVGFAVHKRGFFERTKWQNLTSGAQGRTMKILWDGNLICNNRKAHKRHSALI
jgi:hypothetical protein